MCGEPHPQPGILPTSTIAREVRGSERQFSRDPSPWQRLQQKRSDAEVESRRGPVWGLEDPEAECGDETVGTEVRLPTPGPGLELRTEATF